MNELRNKDNHFFNLFANLFANKKKTATYVTVSSFVKLNYE